MTHLYIKICDLCGNPAEVGSQMHAGHLSADIIIKTSKKISTKIFRDEFDICINCLKSTGLFEILLKMKAQKDSNQKVEPKAQKFIQSLENNAV